MLSIVTWKNSYLSWHTFTIHRLYDFVVSFHFPPENTGCGHSLRAVTSSSATFFLRLFVSRTFFLSTTFFSFNSDFFKPRNIVSFFVITFLRWFPPQQTQGVGVASARLPAIGAQRQDCVAKRGLDRRVLHLHVGPQGGPFSAFLELSFKPLLVIKIWMTINYFLLFKFE